MNTVRILIVEDDENLRMALQDNLEDEGYQVSVAATGKLALRELARTDFDLVILDIMLPDIDGYTICKKLRSAGQQAAVLMLTARTLESDLVAGFDAGADDFLSKPYRLRELLARVKALLRRRAAPTGATPVSFRLGPHVVDLVARTIFRDATEIMVTRTEFDLLACLLKHKGEAQSREEILNRAWDPDIIVDPRTVDNFVSNLKRKLEWLKTDSFRIKTVRGVGYRLEID